MKIAAIYARVSTAHQEQEKTIESQIAEVKERLEKDNVILGEGMLFKDEGWSGENLERPALDSLRDAIRLRKIDLLYCYDLGRLSRNFLNQLILKEEFKAMGIKLISLHDIQARNPEEDLMQNVMGLFHSYDRIKIGEKFRRGKQFKVKSGKLLGYTAPYGYRLIKKSSSNDSSFEILNEEAEVVKLMFTLISEKGYTIKKLAEYLHEKEIKPRKSLNGKWSRGRLSTLLSNSTYYGEARYFKTEAIEPKNPTSKEKYRKIKKSSRRLRPEEDHVSVRVPAIISKEMFDKAQAVIKNNTVFSKRNKKNYDYILTKLIRCPCGRARSGEGDVSRGHYYYRCTDRLYDKSSRTCYEKAVRADILDKLVWEEVSTLLTSPLLLKQQLDRWTNKQQTYSPATQFNTEAIETKLIKLKEEEKRYLKAYGEGLIDETLFKEQMSAVRAEIRSLESTIEETNKITHPKNTPIKLPDLEALCGKMKSWLTQVSPDDKKYILRQVIQNITATQQEATVIGKVPLEIPENTKNIEYESIHRHRRPS